MLSPQHRPPAVAAAHAHARFSLGKARCAWGPALPERGQRRFIPGMPRRQARRSTAAAAFCSNPDAFSAQRAREKASGFKSAALWSNVRWRLENPNILKRPASARSQAGLARAARRLVTAKATGQMRCAYASLISVSAWRQSRRGRRPRRACAPCDAACLCLADGGRRCAPAGAMSKGESLRRCSNSR